MSQRLLVLLSLTLLCDSKAQNSDTNSMTDQFQFMVGNWEVITNDTLKGSSTITRTLNGCVYEEDLDQGRYKIRKISGYSQEKGVFQQAIVDNKGAYMVFSGEFKDSLVELSRAYFKPEISTIMVERITYFNIQKDSFSCMWEESMDDGITWKEVARLKYVKTKYQVLQD